MAIIKITENSVKPETGTTATTAVTTVKKLCTAPGTTARKSPVRKTRAIRQEQQATATVGCARTLGPERKAVNATTIAAITTITKLTMMAEKMPDGGKTVEVRAIEGVEEVARRFQDATVDATEAPGGTAENEEETTGMEIGVVTAAAEGVVEDTGAAVTGEVAAITTEAEEVAEGEAMAMETAAGEGMMRVRRVAVMATAVEGIIGIEIMVEGAMAADEVILAGMAVEEAAGMRVDTATTMAKRTKGATVTVEVEAEETEVVEEVEDVRVEVIEVTGAIMMIEEDATATATEKSTRAEITAEEEGEEKARGIAIAETARMLDRTIVEGAVGKAKAEKQVMEPM